MLIDTICTCSNAQIKAVLAAYKSMYMIGMELRVKWDVSGLLQDNLVRRPVAPLPRLSSPPFQDAIMQAKRPESGVQLNLVPEDLALLVKATEGKVGGRGGSSSSFPSCIVPLTCACRLALTRRH